LLEVEDNKIVNVFCLLLYIISKKTKNNFKNKPLVLDILRKDKKMTG
jgi:hypothetical protein